MTDRLLDEADRIIEALQSAHARKINPGSRGAGRWKAARVK